jgi:hypothetical protein
MNIGTIIETIIGLVFIYLILSLLVSEFQEAWGSYREYRAKHLKNAIRIFLSENSEKLNPQQIYICFNKEQKEADECLNEFKTNINNTVEKITPLPIGWNIHFLKNLSLQKILLAIIWLPIKLLGWCISAISISMGAPFWFDLLGKVMNVRNTGRTSSPQPTNFSSNSRS